MGGIEMIITASSDNRWKLKFKYNKRAKEDLKASIVWYEREWNKSLKSWIITPSPANRQELERIAKYYFGTSPTFPTAVTTAGEPFSCMLTIHYIGAPKDFDGISASSALLENGQWRAIFPEAVLKSWFVYGYTPDKKKKVSQNDETLYSVLGTKQTASGIEIKKAYRIASKTWHPDINNDPNAGDMFIKIKDAYDKLSNPHIRAKYDAGLKLQASMPKTNTSSRRTRQQKSDWWKPPVRCGKVICSGQKIGDFYHVESIIAWEPITDSRNRTMISSWKYGDNAPTYSWI